MSCSCRHHVHPPAVDIPAGRDHLPRLLASYGQFRRAMLNDASSRAVLADWTAREQGDLGILLIEMWAVACEIIAFADETICHECFLRTRAPLRFGARPRWRARVPTAPGDRRIGRPGTHSRRPTSGHAAGRHGIPVGRGWRASAAGVRAHRPSDDSPVEQPSRRSASPVADARRIRSR